MTEPVKRYGFGLRPDPTGEWCRYEPRFDAPQLSREEVDLIEWLRCQVKHSYVAPGAIAASRLSKAKQLVDRLRESLPIIRPEPPKLTDPTTEKP